MSIARNPTCSILWAAAFAACAHVPANARETSLVSPYAGPSATALASRLDSLFDAPAWDSARWGVMVTDLATSRVLYERDGRKGFMPASNLKLYTTAAALDRFGPEHRFETKLEAAGTVDADGVLRGHLVITGSGDPSISGRYAARWRADEAEAARMSVSIDASTTGILRTWAAAVKAAGIRKIDGAVVADGSVFDGPDRPGSWQIDYFDQWYAAESSGLAFNENCWDAVVKPGARPGEPAVVENPLGTRYFRLLNHVVTTAPKPAPDGATTAAADSEPEPALGFQRAGLDSNDIVLTGTIALGEAPKTLWGSLHGGDRFSATLVAEELARQGVEVTSGAAVIDDPGARPAEGAARRLVHTHRSEPMARLIAVVNKPSQNFHADMLGRALGAQTSAETTATAPRRRGSFSNGEKAVRAFLSDAGLPVGEASGIRLADGSGLSRQDRVTPRATIALLARMESRSTATAEAFRVSLPVMGVDGTLEKRGRAGSAKGKVHAKTGTINSVSSLSGYAEAADGHRLAFSIMANNFTQGTKAATTVQDQVTEALTAFRAD